MEMQPDIPRYHEDAVARRIFVAVAKNRLPRLRFHDLSFQLIPLAHSTLHLQNTLGMLLIRVNPGLHAKQHALIHHQLAIFPQRDFDPIHGAWGRPFEVITGFVVPAPVTRTFVLVLGSQPAWRTPQMGALGKDRVEPRWFTD